MLGALAGLVGSIQAAEAVKCLLGAGTSLAGRLLLIDLLAATFREVRLRRDPACPACGERPTITRAVELGGPGCPATPSIGARDLAKLVAGTESPTLVDVREEWEFEAGSLPNARNVALGEILAAAPGLPRDREIVVFCSVGPRGERAAELLRGAGFDRVRNLRGGLLAWRDDVDPDAVVA